MSDLYKILGIKKDATQDEIKKAHRKLAQKFHPDKNDGDIFFENMFKQIQEAYDILNNPSKRTQYDAWYKEDTTYEDNWKHTNFEPIIESFSVDKMKFYSGDIVTFRWKIYNADRIVIEPFGLELPATGTKSCQLNNVNEEIFRVTLSATNTNITKSASQKIEMKNKLFEDIKEKVRAEKENPKHYHTKTSTTKRTWNWALEFFKAVACIAILLVMFLSYYAIVYVFSILGG